MPAFGYLRLKILATVPDPLISVCGGGLGEGEDDADFGLKK